MVQWFTILKEAAVYRLCVNGALEISPELPGCLLIALAARTLALMRIPVIARGGSGAKASTNSGPNSGRWRPGVPADDIHSAPGQPRLAAG